MNPYLEVPHYAMPTPEEIFHALNRGKKFTKLDLRIGLASCLYVEKNRAIASCLVLFNVGGWKLHFETELLRYEPYGFPENF